jgi:hypothetical protein
MKGTVGKFQSETQIRPQSVLSFEVFGTPYLRTPFFRDLTRGHYVIGFRLSEKCISFSFKGQYGQAAGSNCLRYVGI